MQTEHHVHGIQTEDPGPACNDGPQGEHEVALIELANVSGGHGVQIDAPSAENDPAPHEEHVIDLLLDEKEPAAQFSQATDPIVENLPGSIKNKHSCNNLVQKITY